MKTFTNRSNCARDAKKALGKDAKNGVDFVIAGSDRSWHWSKPGAAATAATEKAAPPKKKRVKGVRRPLQEQPRCVDFLADAARPEGTTAKEYAKKVKCNEATVRGLASRLMKVTKLQSTRSSRGATYTIGGGSEK